MCCRRPRDRLNVNPQIEWHRGLVEESGTLLESQLGGQRASVIGSERVRERWDRVVGRREVEFLIEWVFPILHRLNETAFPERFLCFH